MKYVKEEVGKKMYLWRVETEVGREERAMREVRGK